MAKIEGNLQNVYKFIDKISNSIPRWIRVIHLVREQNFPKN